MNKRQHSRLTYDHNYLVDNVLENNNFSDNRFDQNLPEPLNVYGIDIESSLRGLYSPSTKSINPTTPSSASFYSTVSKNTEKLLSKNNGIHISERMQSYNTKQLAREEYLKKKTNKMISIIDPELIEIKGGNM